LRHTPLNRVGGLATATVIVLRERGPASQFPSNAPSCLCLFQIRFFLLQNRQGKTRLSKWYLPPTLNSSGGTMTTPEAEKVRIEAEVHRMVTARDKKYTNFIEYNNYKLIYRRYAGLFFTIAVDVHDNELSYLETIHLFVELLDSYFSNVCELDIVFNFNKVYSILDEFILAGEIEETSKREILDRVKLSESLM
jgi:AP-2 complex subunit sigma-1